MENRLRICRILEGFARTLTHRLRTPLSVIQNDLTYFQSLLPEGECGRSLDKCAAISGILKEACPPEAIESHRERIDIVRLVIDALRHHASFSLAGDHTAPFEIPGNVELLSCGFEKLFSSLSRILSEGSLCTASISRDTQCRFVLELQCPLSTSIELDADTSDSLTGFFCLTAGFDFHEAPVCDAVFIDHGFSIGVSNRSLSRSTPVITLTHG